MATTLTLRIPTNRPLTNVEVDDNFLSLSLNKLEKDLNLSDVPNKPLARTNLGADNASNLVTGIIPLARLASNSPSSSTFLRGDGIWAEPETASTNLLVGPVPSGTSSQTHYITFATAGNLSVATLQNLNAATALTYVPSTGDLATAGNITSGGDITATNFNSLSDIRFKENVETLSGALEIVSQMRGVSFTWKEDGRASNGVIAQELELVVPSAVVHNTDLDVKTVYYDQLIAFLIEAVKELKAEVDNLKAAQTP